MEHDNNQVLRQSLPFSKIATCRLRGCPSLFNLPAESDLQVSLMSVTWQSSGAKCFVVLQYSKNQRSMGEASLLKIISGKRWSDATVVESQEEGQP